MSRMQRLGAVVGGCARVAAEEQRHRYLLDDDVPWLDSMFPELRHDVAEGVAQGEPDGGR